jgi:hypothetical protein
MPRKRSAAFLVSMFAAEPELLEKLKADPLPVLQEAAAKAEALADAAYLKDAALYRIAVVALCLLALSAAIGSILLALAGKSTPEVLVALGSAAVGALVGLFAPSPASS